MAVHDYPSSIPDFGVFLRFFLSIFGGGSLESLLLRLVLFQSSRQVPPKGIFCVAVLMADRFEIFSVLSGFHFDFQTSYQNFRTRATASVNLSFPSWFPRAIAFCEDVFLFI